jgi:hypothetical protein
MLNHVPHTIEALLDLIPPAMLAQLIEYQTTAPYDTIEDWEPKHLYAADALCSYAEITYCGKLDKQTSRLRRKLGLTDADG